MKNDVDVTEVVVIGGGIIGLSTAYFLAKRGVDVTLIEKNELASGATGSNNGMCGGDLGDTVRGIWHMIYKDLNKEFNNSIDYIESPDLIVYTPENIMEMKELGIYQQFIGNNTLDKSVKNRTFVS